MSNICPKCQKESTKAKCEGCGFEMPAFAFLSEDDANKWYKDTVVPYRVNGENSKKKSLCKKCGKEMQEEWKVCPYCGISKTNQVKPEEDIPVTVKRQTSSSKIAIIVVSLTVIIIGIFFVALSKGGGTTTVHTVSFNAVDASGTVPPAQTASAGSPITLPDADNLLRTGHTFGGWNTEKDGTGTNYRALSSFTPTGNIDLYAKWNKITYTVAYITNGGTGSTPLSQTVDTGSSITLPSGDGFTRRGYTFGGWNTEKDGTGTNYRALSSFTPTGNIDLYAKWNSASRTPTYNANSGTGTAPTAPQTVTAANTGTQSGGDITVAGTSLANKLSWLQNNAQSNRSYLIEVNANESIAPQTLSYSGRNNITITIRGVGANRIISLSSNGYMFQVQSGVTLVLDNNITLQGRNNNGNYAVVLADSGGAFRMNTGSTVTGNTSGAVGGVFIHTGANFTMTGGTISGNTADRGGGVGVNTSGTFTMTGGTISGNTAGDSGGGVIVFGSFDMSGGATITGNTAGRSGGVYVASGTFTMSNGAISGNTANNRGGGGGVGVNNSGTFTMTGGTISGNTAGDSGGGVIVFGSFDMSGGATITGNTAGGGGGVYVGGTFTMSNGAISGNTANNRGGGVLVGTSLTNGVVDGYGTFTMRGGTISGNTASTYGGGAYINSTCTFTKTGGTITGDGTNNGNMVKNSSGRELNNRGHAVYVSDLIRKETATGPGVNLSYNGSNGTSSGEWR